MVLSRPDPGEHVVMRGMAGASLQLAFGPEVCTAFLNSRDLVLLFRNGAVITIEEFIQEDGGTGESIIVLEDGSNTTFLEFLELFEINCVDRSTACIFPFIS